MKLDKNNILDYFYSQPRLSHDVINHVRCHRDLSVPPTFHASRKLGLRFSSDFRKFVKVLSPSTALTDCAIRDYGINGESSRLGSTWLLRFRERLTSDGPHHLPGGPLILPPRIPGITIRLRVIRVKHPTGKDSGNRRLRINDTRDDHDRTSICNFVITIARLNHVFLWNPRHGRAGEHQRTREANGRKERR